MCDTANVWMSEHKTPFYLDTYHLPNCGGTQFNRSAESIEQRRSLSKRGVLCYYVFITSISFEFFMGCPIPLCRQKILRCCNICNGSWWENCWHLIGCEGEIASKCSLCGRWTICARYNMQRRVSTRDFQTFSNFQTSRLNSSKSVHIKVHCTLYSMIAVQSVVDEVAIVHRKCFVAIGCAFGCAVYCHKVYLCMILKALHGMLQLCITECISSGCKSAR